MKVKAIMRATVPQDMWLHIAVFWDARDSGHVFFNGKVKKMKFYNRVLSDQEIADTFMKMRKRYNRARILKNWITGLTKGASHDGD